MSVWQNAAENMLQGFLDWLVNCDRPLSEASARKFVVEQLPGEPAAFRLNVAGALFKAALDWMGDAEETIEELRPPKDLDDNPLAGSW